MDKNIKISKGYISEARAKKLADLRQESERKLTQRRAMIADRKNSKEPGKRHKERYTN